MNSANEPFKVKNRTCLEHVEWLNSNDNVLACVHNDATVNSRPILPDLNSDANNKTRCKKI